MPLEKISLDSELSLVCGVVALSRGVFALSRVHFNTSFSSDEHSDADTERGCCWLGVTDVLTRLDTLQ